MAGIPPLCMTFPLSREKLKYLPFACVSNILSLSLPSIFPPVSLFLPSSFSFFLPFFLSFISPRRREGEDNDDKWRVDNCSTIKITTVDYKVMRKAINTSSSSFGRVKSFDRRTAIRSRLKGSLTRTVGQRFRECKCASSFFLSEISNLIFRKWFDLAYIHVPLEN